MYCTKDSVCNISYMYDVLSKVYIAKPLVMVIGLCVPECISGCMCVPECVLV